MSESTTRLSRLESAVQRRPRNWIAGALLAVAVAACGKSSSEPTAIALVDAFPNATIDNAVAPDVEVEPVEWRFDGDGDAGAGATTGGWSALNDVDGLAIREGTLAGRSGELPILVAAAPAGLDDGDILHAIEIRMKVSAGERLGVAFVAEEELDAEAVILNARESPGDLNTDLIPGDEMQTYTLTGLDSLMAPSFPFSRFRHLIIRPTDEAGADFEIESVRVISRSEHLASIESGVGWHGLGEIYRETVVSRSPERLAWDLDLPSRPVLELALGTIADGPLTFRVEIGETGEAAQEVLRRTVTKPREWQPATLDLQPWAGRRATLTLSLEAEEPGTLGFWGGPTIRNQGSQPIVAEASAARSALDTSREGPPQGVILIVADTLRRDHLQPYGYERQNAPMLTSLAAEGALFRDNISQGAWTKVAVPSILTSLYPSTHGIVDMPDRISASITTLAEAFRKAGYATFATSSVPFSGKLSNLHQGVEVLHERPSITDLGPESAKTARTYVDRLLPWIEEHREVPFFAFLHVFDPHSPFEPFRPYNSMWMDADEMAAFRKDMETVSALIEEPFFKAQALPTQEEMDASGVDQETYIAREKIWYDASIRAMDAEIGRVVERLEELGLNDDTLIVFMSDHGEEFLEHGRSFHGFNAYGEMLNVPLILHWPGVIPAGVEVEDTVESIDVMPTLLDLSRIELPAEVQGQSLVPLLAADANPAELGWRRRPAFSERAFAPAAFQHDEGGRSSISIVDGDWKLVRNLEGPEGWPEFELFDHRNDPINMHDVAADHPDVVERLAETLEAWHRSAVAARIEPDAGTEGMSAEEIQRLRSLGYLN